MNNTKGNWPAVAVNPTPHPPVPLSNTTRQELQAIFKRHKQANKGPREKFIRALEIALGRYKTNRMIEDNTGKDSVKKELAKLEDSARAVEERITGLSITARMILSQAMDIEQNPRDGRDESFEEHIEALRRLGHAARSGLKLTENFNSQLQYARQALVCDVGEALADLTEGGMSVTGDPGVTSPIINQRRDGMLTHVYCLLFNQIEEKDIKSVGSPLQLGIASLQRIRALERQAEESMKDADSKNANLELRAIQRLKDALEEDR